MKNLRKVMLISSITLGLLGGAMTAQANHHAPQASKVVVVSEPVAHHGKHKHHGHGHCKHRRHHHVAHVYAAPVRHVVYHPVHHVHHRHDVLRLPIWLSINI